MRSKAKIDAVILWNRGDAKIPMYFKGMCDRADEGQRGFDVKCRPVSLGPGEYTVTVGGSDVIWNPDNTLNEETK